MSRPSVYLAGPITGLTLDEAVEWREPVARELGDAGIDAYSPLRMKHYLRDYGVLEKQYQGVHPLSNDRGIMTRDRNDVINRDAVLVNFLGSTRVSVGTVMEIAWADILRKPLICVMEPDNLHHHAMLNEACGFIVHTLEEGVEIVKAVLLP